MKRFQKSIALTATLMAALFAAQPATACEECRLRKDGAYLGQFTLLGNGTVRSWVKFDKGRPTSLGVTLSEGALTGLMPVEEMPAKMPMMEYVLALPVEAKVTGFDHISLDWNPVGHPPQPIYTKPHFDVHFYLMSREDRLKITAAGKDVAICEKKPEARYFPAGYVMPPETAVPNMGAHAVDGATPELPGKPFASTFIYGYYNGRMNFVEPMVALEFLQSKPNLSSDIKLPQSYQRSGFYPTRYSITFDEKRREYSVALDGLTWREADSTATIAKTQPAKIVAGKTSAAKPSTRAGNPKQVAKQ